MNICLFLFKKKGDIFCTYLKIMGKQNKIVNFGDGNCLLQKGKSLSFLCYFNVV